MIQFRFDPATEFITAAAFEPDDHLLPHLPGDSSYVELVYAGIVGPTALLAYRRLVRAVTAAPGPVRLEVAELEASLGVGRAIALRGIERCVGCRFAHLDGDSLAVHTAIPVITERHYERLSVTARSDHHRLLRELPAAS